jgi:dolichol-phosphate mannosyltransferase
MKTVVVVPTYDEADNLADFTRALLALPLDDLEVLVVDDASPDGTGAIADQLAADFHGDSGGARCARLRPASQ